MDNLFSEMRSNVGVSFSCVYTDGWCCWLIAVRIGWFRVLVVVSGGTVLGSQFSGLWFMVYGLLKDSFAVTKLNYRVYIFTNLWDDNRVYYNILFTI